MKEKEKIKIILLAAGKGVRMESDEPKALVLYKHKPFIKHILDTISTLSFEADLIIIVGHKKERIKEVLGDGYKYAEQEKQLGTGDAVKAAKKYSSGEDIVLVISADQPTVSKETLENIVAKQKEKIPSITLATVVVSDFEGLKSGMNHFGRIIRETDGSVKKIVEFKDANEEEKKVKELNLALYAFDAQWLWENIDKSENNNIQGEYYLTDLVKIARDQNKKIEAVPVMNIIEGIHPNSKAELEILEKFSV